ncbi:hypothetical protein [Flexivirga oryzae]|uniref:Transcriptional regulator, AbiEi antitoxin, Type IV TA system n=1 Tax=Flexivirga oryzae TaxID=1794944 RepID=A0A839NIE7_9MICO|nr:hypothetical protein [Flexivirga oryzae]MBB2894431.1 hypothetical protein [Flexivirga oryzae]
MGPQPLRTHEVQSLGRLRQAGIVPWAAVARGTGQWMRIRRGEYLDKGRWHTLTPLDRHRALVVATVRRMRDPLPMLSHFAAAALWGMPIIGSWPDRVDVMLDASAAGSSTLVRRHRVSGLPEPSLLGEFPVTSPARTVIDLARSTTLACALSAADWTLRNSLCTYADLDEELLAIPGRGPGRRGAHAVWLLADPRAESPGESLSRARMYESGFPQPDLQVPLEDAQGWFGRADFGWPGRIGEFDGLRKYRATGDAGDTASEEIVIREKLREDRARRAGTAVARWVWTDALHGSGLVRALVAVGVSPGDKTEWLRRTPAEW